jgi:hypothetical protein
MPVFSQKRKKAQKLVLSNKNLKFFKLFQLNKKKTLPFLILSEERTKNRTLPKLVAARRKTG